MKRLLCIMLILVMAFGATAPVYAEAWTSGMAQSVTTNVNLIETILQLYIQGDSQYNGTIQEGSLQSVAINLAYVRQMMEDWIIPRNITDTTTYLGMWDYVWGISQFAYDLVQNSSSIMSYVASWMNSNNNYLHKLNLALTYTGGSFTEAWSYEDIINKGNYWLFNEHSDLTGTKRIGDFRVPYVYPNGTTGNGNLFWQDGTPLGTMALMLRTFMDNQVNSHYSRWSADLTHYNDQLSTWDSQGDSLQQVLFTPDSAIQGLYRYLAFLQRDVARMTYIIADPHEQAGMENANESGVADMYADVYDADNGGVTLSDMSDTFNTQKVAKQTFNTGVSFSTNGLFSFTDDGNWGFWSTAVKNDMDNVPMTRKSESYDSTAYYNQLEELYSIWGIKDGK